MPTIHRERGFRFMIYFDEHGPAHVHALHAGAIAKLSIGNADVPPEVLDPGKMDTRRVRKAVRIVEANQERFLEAWSEIHGQ